MLSSTVCQHPFAPVLPRLTMVYILGISGLLFHEPTRSWAATHIVSEQKRPAYCHLMFRMAWGNPDWLQKAQVTSIHASLLVTLKRPRTILQAGLWWLVVGRFYRWCSGFWPHWCNMLVMVVQRYWEVHSYNNGTHSKDKLSRVFDVRWRTA